MTTTTAESDLTRSRSCRRRRRNSECPKRRCSRRRCSRRHGSRLRVGLALALSARGGGERAELAVSQIVHAGGVYENPLDAVPGAGGAVYFTADGSIGPGVFVAPSNHEEPRALAPGRPFGRPVGLAVSADERTAFVADAQADAVFSRS